MIFDFADYIQNIRYRRWSIDRVGTRIGQIFALQFVFGLVANKALWKVRGRLNRFRRLWIYRLRDFVVKELWFPTKTRHSPYDTDFDLKKFTHDFRRCMFCRPALVHFQSRDGRAIKIRPCWKTHICPFCWANLVAAQYVYVKHAINQLVKQDKELVAICRVAREYVPAPVFSSTVGPEAHQLDEYIAPLRRAILKHKARYAKVAASKALQRKTLGSIWRLVVIPDEAGWQVEIRQFFVCRVGVKPPIVNTRGCRVVVSKSVRLNNSGLKLVEDFYNIFGDFCRYPIELLTGYSHLVAAYLHAAHDERLVTGTGAFVKTGRALIIYMREHVAHAKAKREAKKARRHRAASAPAQDGSDSGAGEVRL